MGHSSDTSPGTCHLNGDGIKIVITREVISQELVCSKLPFIYHYKEKKKKSIASSSSKFFSNNIKKFRIINISQNI